MKIIPVVFAILVPVAMAIPSLAQNLPLPSRTVFKCGVAGKIVYSDSPCLGAKRIQVEPTRGLNKGSGSEKIGVDVRQERRNEQMAEALRPVFGETAEQRTRRHRRMALNPQDRAKCSKLESEMPATEQAELRATKAETPAIQVKLLRLRTQYRDLKC